MKLKILALCLFTLLPMVCIAHMRPPNHWHRRPPNHWHRYHRSYGIIGAVALGALTVDSAIQRAESIYPRNICRQVPMLVYVNGRREMAYTIMCQDQYGYWNMK